MKNWQRLWRYGRALLAPGLIWVFLVAALVRPIWDWLDGDRTYDENAIREWIEEARNFNSTLAELVEDYVECCQHLLELQRQLEQKADESDLLTRSLAAQVRVAVNREEIYQHLRALGEPPTKMYQGQLPLFPVIYRLEVHFTDSAFPQGGETTINGGPRMIDPVMWDSGLEPSSGQSRPERIPLGKHGLVKVNYQLHAWNKRQREELERAQRVQWLLLLAVAATVLGAGWLLLVGAKERAHRQKRLELERQAAESQRQLLEQQLATQAAEQQTLEVKSQIYASIGIMAGSYAHNIKNLLVRPNDLLRRCLEPRCDAVHKDQMLRQVQQTLATVTERLQQILQTVRSDPARSERRIIDVNILVQTLGRTWSELACERWQLDLELELNSEPSWVAGDESHLQQAVENLLFNARDATFEMRNVHREAARRMSDADPAARRQALIQAASWRGKASIRTRRRADSIVLEVTDNGIGMSEEVQKRCTETHFSTKRNNALYEGHSTGMGLGLSFVVAILNNHDGKLEIESRPQVETTFRIVLPEAKRGE